MIALLLLSCAAEPEANMNDDQVSYSISSNNPDFNRLQSIVPPSYADYIEMISSLDSFKDFLTSLEGYLQNEGDFMFLQIGPNISTYTALVGNVELDGKRMSKYNYPEGGSYCEGLQKPPSFPSKTRVVESRPQIPRDALLSIVFLVQNGEVTSLETADADHPIISQYDSISKQCM